VTVELRHGDALSLLREVEDETVDLVLTDPPYSSGGMFRGDRAGMTTNAKYVQTGTIAERADFAGDSRDQRGFLAWASLWLAECWRATKVGGSCLVFTDWRQLPTMTDAVQAGGWIWRGVVVWDKGAAVRPRAGFSARAEYLVWGTRGPYNEEVYLPGVIMAATPRGDERRHMTEKPIGLLEQLLAVCPAGGLILDPFVGSGSTLDAARNRGRHALGFELSVDHLETAGKRLAQGSLGMEAADA
jgi:site-specific DNA-methyltransferase (adenine-specific)